MTAAVHIITPPKAKPRVITFNPDKLDALTALYLIDLIDEHLVDPDRLFEGLQGAAWDIAGAGLHEGNDPYQTRQEGMADYLFPQGGGPFGKGEWDRHRERRDEHLRRAGVLKVEESQS